MIKTLNKKTRETNPLLPSSFVEMKIYSLPLFEAENNARNNDDDNNNNNNSHNEATLFKHIRLSDSHLSGMRRAGFIFFKRLKFFLLHNFNRKCWKLNSRFCLRLTILILSSLQDQKDCCWLCN